MQKYLNTKKVPQLFAATGASKFTDPKKFPWTMGFNPNYFVEGRIYGQYIIKDHPNAKIGILYQNDDLGKDYLNGIKAGLGDKAAKMIVAEASYEVTDPTINSQILKIKDAGADLFFSATTPKQAAQAIKKIAELGWHPVHILDINATSVGAVMKPAGLEASKGVISVNYGKDPLDPTWKDDAGMKKYFEFMAKYYPDGDKDSSFNSYGYSTSQLMIYVLKKCGDNLTRENVMKQATSLKNVQLDLALPGILANTTPDDYRVNKQLQMMKFNGERWELFGPILEDTARGLGARSHCEERGDGATDLSFAVDGLLRCARKTSIAIGGLSWPPISFTLFRNFPERLADRQDRVPDQARILDRRLAVFHRFPVDGIADHFGEGGDARIFGDEAVVPALRLGPDQHQFEAALPDDAAAEPLEHRAAFPAIGRIGFRARRLAAVGIGGLRPQPDQIEHVDRTRPVIGPELREDFLGRIDVAHDGLPCERCGCSHLARARRTS